MARNNGFDAIRDSLGNNDHQFNLNAEKPIVSYYKSLKDVLKNKLFYKYIARKLVAKSPR
ncbi:hypothetical protein COO91_10983 (plasmid) [Nostoc flagelliforme CCNUN1]|uniref:Uncharacterized protein n=1 Tax=Nostoc flagelliforme CCNUN1 TaxID=2038116 RepID=A0A2K8TAX3_9NOSO|nr:hypothetical protein [Nostoc flagelliforme]AUB44743.1 hypothetical protein COO91_10983 [Nostoc flagelliforme CCNUN1]